MSSSLISTALLQAALFNFALLFCVFAPLERLLPARTQPLWRDGSRLDLVFFVGQYLCFGVLSVWILSHVHRALTNVGIGVHQTGHIEFDLSLLVLGVLLGDLLVYWFHRACHRFDALWRFHRVHHSSKHLDWLAAHREHPVDGVLTQLCQNLPALLLGVRLELLAGLIVVRNVWAIFIHSNVKLNVGPLRWVLGAPELHHYHHAKVVQTEHNFANLAPWLDWVFGTYYRPTASEQFELGLPEPHVEGYLPQLVEPFGALGLVRANARRESGSKARCDA